MILRIAELNIEVKNKYEQFLNFTKKYAIETTEHIDFSIEVNDEEIEEERKVSLKTNGEDFPNWYYEYICVYRKIAEKLPLYNAVVMHGSFLEVDSRAYGFLAKSGTGKTTHSELWIKLLKDKVRYVNGDKPILRVLDNEVYVYGTPWCGKEQKENNIKVKLKALCFIERGLTNEISPISNKELISKIFRQIYIPTDPIAADNALTILNVILNNSEKYLLKCNMELDAAKLSYSVMSK